MPIDSPYGDDLTAWKAADALAGPSGDADAAWEALVDDEMDGNRLRRALIARHRPLIEAAIRAVAPSDGAAPEPHKAIVAVLREAKSKGNLAFPYPGGTDDLDEGKLASDVLAALREPSDGAGGLDVASESFCHRCGGPNRVWYAPSPLWNAVMRGGDINGPWKWNEIICPTCFMVLAEDAGVARSWRLDAREVLVPLSLVTPSGRVLDPVQDLWVEPLLPSEPTP